MVVYEKRVSKLKRIVSDAGMDTAVVNSIHDIFYYTGKVIRKEDIAFLLIPVRGKPKLFPSSLSNEITGNKNLIVKPITGNADVIKKDLSQYKKIGFDEKNMSVYIHKKLKRPGQTWKPLSPGIKKPRSVKDSGELNQMKKAIRIALKSFRLDILGKREIDVASEIEWKIRNSGGTLAFPSIVSCGKNSGFIHHIPNKKKIGNGLNILDCGARVNGYCSDLTRTFCFNETKSQRKIYQDVETIQGELIDAAKPGIKFWDLQKKYESLMKRGGYKVYHLFGHGVGLSVHDGPNINDALEPGMVLTVEPGIYEEKRGGCRIEDMIVITKKGCKILSR